MSKEAGLSDMFNYSLRILFALSSASPLLIVSGLVYYLKDPSNLSYFVVLGVTGVLLCLAGGFIFLRFARDRGEAVSVAGSVASVAPSGQWLPVLFGSYLVPLVSLLETAISLEWIIAITLGLVLIALVGQNIPPALALLVAGYRFYELSFDNGAGGYKLITKRRTINDPRTIKSVIRLFDSEYWLLESE